METKGICNVCGHESRMETPEGLCRPCHLVSTGRAVFDVDKVAHLLRRARYLDDRKHLAHLFPDGCRTKLAYLRHHLQHDADIVRAIFTPGSFEAETVTEIVRLTDEAMAAYRATDAELEQFRGNWGFTHLFRVLPVKTGGAV